MKNVPPPELDPRDGFAQILEAAERWRKARRANDRALGLSAAGIKKPVGGDPFPDPPRVRRHYVRSGR
jgi:hypothetical protein